MDAAAKKKALFRAKLNAHKKEQRIDSPLVRYNEADQPICRLCNVTLKSESLWDAHHASRKHHEAVKNLKANASGIAQPQKLKPVPATGSTGPKHAKDAELRDTNIESSKQLPKSQSSSTLPPGFFDNPETKRQKTDKLLISDSKVGNFVQTRTTSTSENEMDGLLVGNDIMAKHNQHASGSEHIATEVKQVKRALPEGYFDNKEAELHTEAKQVKGALPIGFFHNKEADKQVKGALPEGFFDNKEADLRARGIKPVKPDVQDEYKEFEKLIQEDLMVVDNRMEEEEIDAAEMIEEAETVEQTTYREKVELLRKRKVELMAARATKLNGGSDAVGKESSHEDSSSDGDADENFAVDWRAQHL